MKGDANPMSPSWQAGLEAAAEARRCSAHSKRTGEPCLAAAVTGWGVCRHHGAGGGHAAGPSHPRWTHGMRSQQHVEMRRMVNEMVREARAIDALLASGT